MREFIPKKHQAYIYCANHTSYADIPTIYSAVLQDVNFIGKASLRKVPLFGYMYSRLHILVDRKSGKSKIESVEIAKKRIDEGVSIIIFPEGTIPKYNNPTMIDFKDGAFKIAIEKQIPIVPITIPYNYILLPDEDKMKARRHECKIIIHKPIETKGLTLQDIGALKQQTFQIIDAELTKHRKEIIQ
ncbi:MAG: lysophospholipid acyltransferase family protein [Bacteroidota bacterium]|nr:lysophospholipid acyltransferase family protein [Bacteroidota bacterium]